MSCGFDFYVGNTNVVRLTGLKVAAAGPYINDASVEVTIKDMAGASVAGQSWPTTMTYVANSDGDYEGTLSATLAIIAGRSYIAAVSAMAPAALGKAHWEYPFIAHVRTQ